MKKILLPLLVVCLVVPMTVLLTACGGGGLGDFLGGGKDNGETKTDNTHICEDTPCTETHASEVMHKINNWGVNATLNFDPDEGGSTYHYFDVPSGLMNKIKTGNIVVLDFTASFTGSSQQYTTVREVTSNTSTSISTTVYVNSNQIASGTSNGGMMGSVSVTFRNGTGTAGSYIRYSPTLYAQAFTGMQVTLNSITIYGDVK